jgi:hypothetical protein
MKLVFAVVTICVFLAGTWAALFVFNRWAESRKVSPGPANESAFLRGYRPGDLIKQYCGRPGTCSYGTSDESGEDRHYVRHALEFQADLAIPVNREAELVSALQDDFVRQLEFSHTQVTGRDQGPNGSLLYHYRSGNSVGSISMQPPEHPLVERDKPLSEGWEDLRIKLTVEERWDESCLHCA